MVTALTITPPYVSLPSTLPSPPSLSPLTYSPFPTPALSSPTPKPQSGPSSPSLPFQSCSSTSNPTPAPSPPPRPPPWLWTCHLCGDVFPLGATRRCLNDGHFFCSGTTRHPRTGLLRAHKPCGSTFDYAGWTEYNGFRERWEEWKGRGATKGSMARSVLPEKQQEQARDCERNCSFPSECRWRPRLLGQGQGQGKAKGEADALEVLLVQQQQKQQQGLSITVDPSPSSVAHERKTGLPVEMDVDRGVLTQQHYSVQGQLNQTPDPLLDDEPMGKESGRALTAAREFEDVDLGFNAAMDVDADMTDAVDTHTDIDMPPPLHIRKQNASLRTGDINTTTTTTTTATSIDVCDSSPPPSPSLSPKTRRLGLPLTLSPSITSTTSPSTRTHSLTSPISPLSPLSPRSPTSPASPLSIVVSSNSTDDNPASSNAGHSSPTSPRASSAAATGGLLAKILASAERRAAGLASAWAVGEERRGRDRAGGADAKGPGRERRGYGEEDGVGGIGEKIGEGAGWDWRNGGLGSIGGLKMGMGGEMMMELE